MLGGLAKLWFYPSKGGGVLGRPPAPRSGLGKTQEPRKETSAGSGRREEEEAYVGEPALPARSPDPGLPWPPFECCALRPPARRAPAQPYPARFAVGGRANSAPPLGRTIETQAPAGAAKSSESLRTPGCWLLSERLLALAG